MKDHTTYNLQTLFAEDLLLSEAGRQLLQKPLGRLLRDLPEQTRQLITIGDAVTEKANRMGLGQKLSVVDFRVQREKKHARVQDLGFDGSEHILRAINPPGSISHSLALAAEEAVGLLPMEGRSVLIVDGEEDLAVIPFVLASPLGWTILYGQPNEGVVELVVTSETKQTVLQLLGLFSRA